MNEPSKLNEPPQCAKCHSPMEGGFIIDPDERNVRQPAHWVAGPPEKSFWTGTKLKGKDKHEIHTFRCVRCGFLESYAL